MAKMISGEEAVEKLVQKCGDKYDFSKFVYTGSKNKSVVICPKHGPWEVSYEKIMSGRGCPRCRGYLKTTQDVISSIMLVHGDKYDYSKVLYEKSSSKIEIVCKTHGSWFTVVKSLLKGCGCPKCAHDNTRERLTSDTNKFIEEANIVHSGKYDYKLVNYSTCKTPVVIICPSHGEFSQIPSVHLFGGGCKKCSLEAQKLAQTKTQEQCLLDFRTKHGERYDYSLVNYSSSHGLVNIICRKHGLFQQSPSNHISGQGCPVCRYEVTSMKVSKGEEHFIEKAKRTHGEGSYDYSMVKYGDESNSGRQKVKIKCNSCGNIFLQSLEAHSNGRGCRKCNSMGFRFDSEAYLYVMECSEKNFIKIGISKDPLTRVKQISKSCSEELTLVEDYAGIGMDCYKLEQLIHSRLSDIGFKKVSDKFDGSTECFSGVSVTDTSQIISDVLSKMDGVNFKKRCYGN